MLKNVIEIRILKPGEEAILAIIAPGVFDEDIDAKLAREFLTDPRHHIVVALDNGVVVGFASAVDYVHPDKPRELWLNEVGTAPTHQGQGIGKRVMRAILEHGRALGCKIAWVLTDTDNNAARALYKSAGGKELSTDTVHIEFDL
jgi:ribosomal protein S18 acetylase RimI-like enzyme